jgi:hypothetical protein
MKYGDISVKYISYSLKINMKLGGVKTLIYFEGLLSPFCLKNLSDKYKTTFVEFCFENGLE